MNLAQIGVAYSQFKEIGPLFQRLYVNNEIQRNTRMIGDSQATYVVEAGGKRIFAKTVSLRTGKHVRSSIDMVKYPSAHQALDEHFNPAYITKDAVQEMITVLQEDGAYRTGTFKDDPVYGREVFCSDIDELHMENDGFIDLQAMRARLQAQGK